MFSCAGRNIIDGPTIYKLCKNFKIDLKEKFQMCSFIVFTPQMRVSNEKKTKGSTCISTTQLHLVLCHCKT